MPALFTHKKATPKDGWELSCLFNIYKPKQGWLLIKFTNLAFLLILKLGLNVKFRLFWVFRITGTKQAERALWRSSRSLLWAAGWRIRLPAATKMLTGLWWSGMFGLVLIINWLFIVYGFLGEVFVELFQSWNVYTYTDVRRAGFYAWRVVFYARRAGKYVRRARIFALRTSWFCVMCWVLIGYVNVRCLKGRKLCPSSIISRPSSIARAFFGFEGRPVSCFSYGSPRFCVRVYVCLSLYPRLPSFWGCVCAWVCLRACVRSARFDYSAIMLNFVRIMSMNKQSKIYDIKS